MFDGCVTDTTTEVDSLKSSLTMDEIQAKLKSLDTEVSYNQTNSLFIHLDILFFVVYEESMLFEFSNIFCA